MESSPSQSSANASAKHSSDKAVVQTRCPGSLFTNVSTENDLGNPVPEPCMDTLNHSKTLAMLGDRDYIVKPSPEPPISDSEITLANDTSSTDSAQACVSTTSTNIDNGRSATPSSLSIIVPVFTGSSVPTGSNTALHDVELGEPEIKMKTKTTIKSKKLRPYLGLFSLKPFSSSHEEQPKVAIKSGLRGNWLKIAPHIAAAAVTVAVCQLSFRNVYWMDLQPPNKHISPGITQGGALNFLQLAAKLHELLILASVSNIALHATQGQLMSSSGLPLGMMANAFELGSARFLRRKSFWSSLWTDNAVPGRRFPFRAFWLLCLFSTLLVFVSGPSSAIAVIPTLHFFNIPSPKAFNETLLPYYVFNQTELWPARLTTESVNGPNSGIDCRDLHKLGLINTCPTAGYHTLSDWVQGLLWSDSDSGTNITFDANKGAIQRSATIQSCNSTFNGRASGISVNEFITLSMSAYWKFAQKNFQGIALEAARPTITLDTDANIFAPRVETICTMYTNYHFDSKRLDDQPSMTFPLLDNTTSIPVPEWTYKYSRPLNATNVSFVEMPYPGPMSPSLGAIVILPTIIAENEADSNFFQATETLACSIYAQWTPVTISYEPKNSNELSYLVTSDLYDTCLTIPKHDILTGQSINTTLDMAYVNAINAVMPWIDKDYSRGAVRGYFEALTVTNSEIMPNGTRFQFPLPAMQPWMSSNSSQIKPLYLTDETKAKGTAKVVSTILAGIFTEGMARIAGSGEFPFSFPFFLTPNRTEDGSLLGLLPVTSAIYGEYDPLNTTTPSWPRLDFKFQRYGYGYSWSDSPTAQFGISVLLIHSTLALSYSFYLLMVLAKKKNAGFPSSLETISELIALAINSRRSDKLKNTSAGIDAPATWGVAVGVRETDGDHLEFIVGKDEMEQLQRARVGVAYG